MSEEKKHEITFWKYNEERQRCAICNLTTSHYAQSGSHSFPLCSTHQTKEHFIHLLNTRR